MLLYVLLSFGAAAGLLTGEDQPRKEPLVIGDTFTMRSAELKEIRRINVYAPPGYADSSTLRLPVLYMPDGGMQEDFLHIAGLLQISVANGTARPFLLVGIENTERRRDMTGPTTNEEDRKIAPRVGGSAAFRAFIRTELIPEIERRYRTTRERAIIGESLAGLFIVETLLREPELFDTYIAFDPSLWWNNAKLVADAPAMLSRQRSGRLRLYLASSSEPELARLTQELAAALENGNFPGLEWHYEAMPSEQHSTIYHPAALRALRLLFKPPAGK
jgi:predicted alpha/beta superfamily hydrolase